MGVAAAPAGEGGVAEGGGGPLVWIDGTCNPPRGGTGAGEGEGAEEAGPAELP